MPGLVGPCQDGSDPARTGRSMALWPYRALYYQSGLVLPVWPCITSLALYYQSGPVNPGSARSIQARPGQSRLGQVNPGSGHLRSKNSEIP